MFHDISALNQGPFVISRDRRERRSKT
jgi:hypothetical protein